MMWKDSLSIGIPEIDKQHKELCDRIDALFEACSKGKGRNEITNTMDFLESYTIKHFSDEEKLQLKIKYPNYTQHKAIHDNFLKQVSELKEELNKTGPTIAMVGKINQLIAMWLVNHIKAVDTELVKYVNQ